jgi:hypothetical protein
MTGKNAASCTSSAVWMGLISYQLRCLAARNCRKLERLCV